jgi:hypothetical protein
VSAQLGRVNNSRAAAQQSSVCTCSFPAVKHMPSDLLKHHIGCRAGLLKPAQHRLCAVLLLHCTADHARSLACKKTVHLIKHTARPDLCLFKNLIACCALSGCHNAIL